MKISEELKDVVKKYWNVGKIRRFSIKISQLTKLKKLGIIRYADKGCHYVIDREAYLRMTEYNQRTLSL